MSRACLFIRSADVCKFLAHALHGLDRTICIVQISCVAMCSFWAKFRMVGETSVAGGSLAGLPGGGALPLQV